MIFRLKVILYIYYQLGPVPTIRKCRFARRFFANQGSDDVACPKAREEELTQSGGNIDRKCAFSLVETGPKFEKQEVMNS